MPNLVTSIKPASINTPFFNNAGEKLGVKPKGAPPIYQPTVVADCVLFAAENPVRDLYAGGAGKMLAMGQMLGPGLIDTALARFGIDAQLTDEPRPAETPGAMFVPRTHEDRIEGDFSGQARDFSLYTWLETHPEARALAAGSLLAGAAYLLSRAERNGTPATPLPPPA